MRDKLKKIKELAVENLKGVNDLKALDDLRVKFLGKNGELTHIL